MLELELELEQELELELELELVLIRSKVQCCGECRTLWVYILNLTCTRKNMLHNTRNSPRAVFQS